ncbi:MAG: thioredoxin family protein [Lentimicrobium sp.]|jgi:thiol-disulfide isomerase/thioredoxin|nr:thioredoxin family protein [Lentimicrobium sp.]
MKITALTFLILGSSLFAFAQEDNQRITDEKSGKEIMIGTVTREGLADFSDWFNIEYQQYQPDSSTIASIQNSGIDYPWVFIVMGTWCGDSRQQVPHFFKILDQLNYPSERIFMVAVDRDKKTKDFCLGDYNIQLVPTFIFTREGEETGRIIETPTTTLEGDLLDIFKKRITEINDLQGNH